MSINTSPTGIILLFLAVASAVVYVVFLKRLSLSYTPVTIITVQNGIGVIYFLPLFLYADIPEIFAVSPSWQAVGSIILLGVLASSVAYVLFTYVIATIGISRGNMYANLIPLCAAVASYFILGEQFTIIKIVGMIVIIFGLVLSEIKFKKPTLKLDVN